MMRAFELAVLGAALTALPSAASAATFDVALQFGTANFQYGTYVAGVFTPFTTNYTNGSLNIYAGGVGSLPEVLKNTGSTEFSNGGTVRIPAGAVYMHPSSSADSVLRFVAPQSGTYTISGAFTRTDITTSGNGTLTSIFSNTSLGSVNLFSGSLPAQNGYQSSAMFNGLSSTLAVGDTIDFVVNSNNGDLSFDGTLLSASLTTPDAVGAVPEPSTWAMMLIGFGAIGASMRRRRRVSAIPQVI